MSDPMTASGMAAVPSIPARRSLLRALSVAGLAPGHWGRR